MMSKQNRGRGRPKGDGVDDSAMLLSIADQITFDPSIRPAKAMRVYCNNKGRRQPTDSERRRWHSKWNARGDDLMIEAKARKLEVDCANAQDRVSRHLERTANLSFGSSRLSNLRVAIDPEIFRQISDFAKIQQSIMKPELLKTLADLQQIMAPTGKALESLFQTNSVVREHFKSLNFSNPA